MTRANEEMLNELEADEHRIDNFLDVDVMYFESLEALLQEHLAVFSLILKEYKEGNIDVDLYTQRFEKLHTATESYLYRLRQEQ